MPNTAFLALIVLFSLVSRRAEQIGLTGPMVFDIGGIVANLEPDYPEREKRSGQLPSNHGGLDFIVRLYQPRMEALDGSWTFPSLEPVE